MKLITKKEFGRVSEVNECLRSFGEKLAKELETVVKNNQKPTYYYLEITLGEIEFIEGKIHFSFREYCCQSEEHFGIIQVSLDDINSQNIDKIVSEFFENERIKALEAEKQKALKLIEEQKQNEITERKYYEKLKIKYGET